jgi:hypothetical protein
VEAVAVGQPVHRDDRLNGVRPSGQVERRAQRSGADDVAHPGDLAVGEPIPVDHQARVRTKVARHGDLGWRVGVRRASGAQHEGRRVTGEHAAALD